DPLPRPAPRPGAVHDDEIVFAGHDPSQLLAYCNQLRSCIAGCRLQLVFSGTGFMHASSRSGCPINLSIEVLGDKWSLVILRDMIFGGRRHFRELLTGSLEGIASNILADRLRRLVEAGVLTRADDPTHKQKAIYSLTEMGVQLVPVLVALGTWG